MKTIIQKVGDRNFPGQIDGEEVGYILENIKSMDMDEVQKLKRFSISDNGDVRIGYMTKELSKNIVYPRVQELVNEYANDEESPEIVTEKNIEQNGNGRIQKKYAFGHEIKQGISSKEIDILIKSSLNEGDTIRIKRLHTMLNSKESQIALQQNLGRTQLQINTTYYGVYIGDKHSAIIITPKLVLKISSTQENQTLYNVVTVYKKGAINIGSFNGIVQQTLPSNAYFEQVYKNITKAFDLRYNVEKIKK